ncbi:MAG: hypothetical protein WC953_11835 [Pseudomonas sp.]
MRLNLIHSGLLVVLLGLSAASCASESSADQSEEEVLFSDAEELSLPASHNLDDPLSETTAADSDALVANEDDLGVPLEQNQRQMLKVYHQQIAVQEAAFDTYDLHLSESLNGLGNVQQQLGMHEEALQSFRRAMHIQRVNNGIYSLSQEPMLRGMMSAYEAMRDLDSADESFERIFGLYTRNYDRHSPEMIGMLKEKSDWHLRAYSRNPDRKSLHHLGNAYRLMVEALNTVSAETPVGNVTLLPLWRNLALANFLLADHGRRHPVGQKEGISFTTMDRTMVDPLSQDEVLVVNSYRSGVVALENIFRYHALNPDATLEQKAAALADLADWHLMFGRYSSAGKVYREAWNLLGEDQEARRQLFGKPRIIPVSEESVGDPVQDSKNPYVVAHLSITSQGTPRNIDIVETFPDNDEIVKKAGYKVLRSARFRPRLADGEMVASDIDYRLEIAP